MTTENSGISRRTLVKGAAWSMPVIAVAAATPLAAASVATSDLVPALSGPISLDLGFLASVDTVNTLTITNNGTSASVDSATVALVYDSSLLSLQISGVGISVLGSDGSYTIELPAIAAGDSLVINLGTTLDSLLNIGLLTELLGGPQQQMVATVAGDGNAANNVATSDIGINIL